jgi:hypothetical protein
VNVSAGASAPYLGVWYQSITTLPLPGKQFWLNATKMRRALPHLGVGSKFCNERVSFFTLTLDGSDHRRLRGNSHTKLFVTQNSSAAPCYGYIGTLYSEAVKLNSVDNAWCIKIMQTGDEAGQDNMNHISAREVQPRQKRGGPIVALLASRPILHQDQTAQ